MASGEAGTGRADRARPVKDQNEKGLKSAGSRVCRHARRRLLRSAQHLGPKFQRQPWKSGENRHGLHTMDLAAKRIEAVEPAQPIHANLIEFPREIVATRKVRPRLAEGPLGALWRAIEHLRGRSRFDFHRARCWRCVDVASAPPGRVRSGQALSLMRNRDRSFWNRLRKRR